MGFEINGRNPGERSKTDYHIHTWFSDGRLAPAEIVRQAKDAGYMEIAITDHDGMDGVQEALRAGELQDLSVIPGVELATETKEDGLELHILGYGMDPENPELLTALKALKQKREKRNRTLLAVLTKMGYPLDDADLKRENGGHYIGKPVIARAMEARGYIGNFKEAFEPGKYLESPEAKAVKKEKIKTEDAISLLNRSGGIAVLAHPIQIRGMGERGSREFYENLDRLVMRLKEAGLSGIECYHPDHSQENEKNFVKLAQKYDLQITRGSDFHGDRFA